MEPTQRVEEFVGVWKENPPTKEGAARLIRDSGTKIYVVASHPELDGKRVRVTGFLEHQRAPDRLVIRKNPYSQAPQDLYIIRSPIAVTLETP
jgi:hypothetical protein